ncbi:MAG TPA: arsenate reductase family protein [Acetivibrio sp.]|nr:arsenate reductase family protein [Clostridium sp.]HPT91899.1 arsenate reductase family protein [Acetivibrio sp.]
MIFVCYPKCTTCQKTKKWLTENGIAFEERNIKENNPTMEEIKEWHKMSGLPLNKFFNTSGLLYKELKLKDKLPDMSEDEKYNLLASDGMIVKRPILIGDGFVLVGFKEADWKAALGIK